MIYVWTFAATFGAFISAWVAVDAYFDLRALGSISNGRRIIALGWVRREVIRFGVQATWATIGFLSLGAASGPVSLIVLLLVGTNLAVALSTILDARDRLRLRKIIGS